jgi:hypothetical protein
MAATRGGRGRERAAAAARAAALSRAEDLPLRPRQSSPHLALTPAGTRLAGKPGSTPVQAPHQERELHAFLPVARELGLLELAVEPAQFHSGKRIGRFSVSAPIDGDADGRTRSRSGHLGGRRGADCARDLAASPASFMASPLCEGVCLAPPPCGLVWISAYATLTEPQFGPADGEAVPAGKVRLMQVAARDDRSIEKRVRMPERLRYLCWICRLGIPLGAPPTMRSSRTLQPRLIRVPVARCVGPRRAAHNDEQLSGHRRRGSRRATG